MTEIHHSLCMFRYTEFSAGLHLSVQNVWGIFFWDTVEHKMNLSVWYAFCCDSLWCCVAQIGLVQNGRISWVCCGDAS